MDEGRVIFRILDEKRSTALAKAVALIAIIAIADWQIDLDIAFGVLYLFPMLVAGGVLSRWQIAGLALLCTALADVFDPFPFTLRVALPQDILVFSALVGTGLFAHEVTRNRRAQQENLKRVEEESAARRDAEEQLKFLIESSPAAVLTATTGGTILLANSAAHRLLAIPAGELAGKDLNRYIPSLGRVPPVDDPAHAFCTEMQCRGERENGDAFLANVFFSTYKTRMGPRLAAVVVDSSEELRDREEFSRQQLLAGSRVLAGAVSHEIRNVCAAISNVHENLIRSGMLSNNKDFGALGLLVGTLNRIASLELKQSTSLLTVGAVDVREILDDLRIVLEPYSRDADIQIQWSVPESLPAVLADRHSLLQVLLNLTKNSERALADWPLKRISIAAVASEQKLSIRIRDTGPGISFPDKLFQPFQDGADSAGLGLYLSRAFMRSFGGDLRHDIGVPGCCFVVELLRADRGEIDDGARAAHATHTTSAG
jgi:two-component system, LuxR family, sensor kinase FixL